MFKESCNLVSVRKMNSFTTQSYTKHMVYQQLNKFLHNTFFFITTTKEKYSAVVL